jgi:hypothetical protein
MSRYSMLVKVLDGIRNEAAGTKWANLYGIGSTDAEVVWQARSRAYIHLYLKVMFGIADFKDRESFITDGPRDGGIDGYYIDTDARRIYIIQSKFRKSEENFESKVVELSELLSMQIKRVLGGEEKDEGGHKYNGKIVGLQRRINEIYDLGRYDYQVKILANLRSVTKEKLLRLTDGIDAEVIDYTTAYGLLLYPVLSGTLFRAHGLSISLDLSNKSSGTKIGYQVTTKHFTCDILVVFVPTLEIARIMSQYKNSILVYNPRSYLEFEGEKVNSAIRDSIIESPANDFALLNNGITIICDESGVNEQSGRKNKAQLFLLNPQIINGGQTAYTLSRIYEGTEPRDRDELFEGKEVLVKAIAVEQSQGHESEQQRVELIERISTATNSQTVVTLADRMSSDPLSIRLQELVFERFGLLYERKRGEFSEGLREGYITSSDIVSRVRFMRIYLTANGFLSKALRKRVTVHAVGSDIEQKVDALDNFLVAYSAFDVLRRGKNIMGTKGYVALLPKVYAAMTVAESIDGELRQRGVAAAQQVERSWPDFMQYLAKNRSQALRTVKDPDTGKQVHELREARNSFGSDYVELVREFFSQRLLAAAEGSEIDAAILPPSVAPRRNRRVR